MAQRETRLLWEFLQATYPGETWSTNVELGTLPEDDIMMRGVRGAAARLRPFRRRVDAVHWTSDRYDLIEAKIRDPLPGLGGLLIYEALAKVTPGLIGYTGQPIHKILVVPFALQWIRDVADELGVEVVEFWREWIADYYRAWQNYFTREYRIARDERKEKLRLMGLE